MPDNESLENGLEGDILSWLTSPKVPEEKEVDSPVEIPGLNTDELASRREIKSRKRHVNPDCKYKEGSCEGFHQDQPGYCLGMKKREDTTRCNHYIPKRV